MADWAYRNDWVQRFVPGLSLGLALCTRPGLPAPFACRPAGGVVGWHPCEQSRSFAVHRGE